MKPKKETLDLFETFMQTEFLNESHLDYFFGGFPFTEPKKSQFEDLGDGYELRPIELTKEESEDKYLVDLKYSHLYHNGQKVSELIFRKGGTGGTFRDGYCQLIYYVRDKNRDSGFSFGEHVIIDGLGKIVLNGGGFSDYPSHDGGNVAHMKELFYDLRTGKPFMVKSSDCIDGKNSIIVNHRYGWYGKELDIPTGIYKIDKETCEVTKIDEIR